MSRIRRCAILAIEPIESLTLSVGGLLAGGGLRSHLHWQARAGHLDEPVSLSAGACHWLGTISPSLWQPEAALRAARPGLLDRLLDEGLLVSDDSACPRRYRHSERDQRLRAQHWHPLAALYHRASLWSQATAERREGYANIAEMVARLGPPPAETIDRPGPRRALPRPAPSSLETLLQARQTCRNYDTAAALDLDACAALLHRVFAARAARQLAPDSVALKKTSPSGGSLHPLECHLLVQRVDGLDSGLYHYRPREHALSQLSLMDSGEALALAKLLLAGQDYFADAAVLFLLSSRFGRGFWKYRRHPKAYRAQILDAGHLSQSLYLAATELGLGAFITAAINEHELLGVLDLDPIDHGPLAILGVGVPAQTRHTVEFRPSEAERIGPG